MIRIPITIEDAAGPYLKKGLYFLRSQKQPMHRAMAEGASALIQNHFAGLATTNRNRFGVRGGFWNLMLAGTKALATETAGYVLMPRAVALRLFGGTITPKRTKFLPIAARGEAYNKSPRDFNDLRFVPTASDGSKGMLVKRRRSTFSRNKKTGKTTRRREAEDNGGAYYFLVKSATIRPNPAVLPTDEQIVLAAAEAGEVFIKNRLLGLS